MKKILLPFAFIVAFTNASCTSSTDSTVYVQPSPVVSPVMPAELSIAGDKIEIDRFDIREKVDRELTAFSYMHSSTTLLIKRANRYFPEVEPILKEMGVPDDLKYLMAVESNLVPTIVSPAGAAGLWQLMPETARELGLEVNKDIDERFNTPKATRAACQYLLQAYARYGNWWNVAASYNAGQGYISSQLREQHQSKVIDTYLYQETSRYFYRIAALKILMSDPQQYGFFFHKEDLYPAYQYKEVPVDTTVVSLVDWAIEQGTTLAFIKEANPWLRTRRLPNKSRRNYVLRVLTKDFIYIKPQDIKLHNKQWIVE